MDEGLCNTQELRLQDLNLLQRSQREQGLKAEPLTHVPAKESNDDLRRLILKKKKSLISLKLLPPSKSSLPLGLRGNFRTAMAARRSSDNASTATLWHLQWKSSHAEVSTSEVYN